MGHTLNTQTLRKTDEQKKKVLSKLTILCWAITAILGRVQPSGLQGRTPLLVHHIFLQHILIRHCN